MRKQAYYITVNFITFLRKKQGLFRLNTIKKPMNNKKTDGLLQIEKHPFFRSRPARCKKTKKREKTPVFDGKKSLSFPEKKEDTRQNSSLHKLFFTKGKQTF